MEQTHIKRGKVIFFNTEICRPGAENDVDKITATFQGLNAEVESCINYSASDVKRKMNEVKNTDFSEYEYLTVVWGSHGSEDGIVQTAVQEFIYLQRALLLPMCKNKTLSNKLKWIITQTCRGDLEMEGPFSMLEEEFYDPKYYLISYSTTEGFDSTRSVNYGSIFIRILCYEIQKHYKHSDILTILKGVSVEVEAEVKKIKNTSSQKPCNEDNFGDTFSFSFCC